MLLTLCAIAALTSSGCGTNEHFSTEAASQSSVGLFQVSKEVSASNSESQSAVDSSLFSAVNTKISGSGAQTQNPPVAQKESLQSRVDEPVELELEDWRSGSAASIGKISFDSPMPNLIFQDVDLNAEMGAVKVTGVKKSIVWAGFEFGAVAFLGDKLAEGGKDLHQVLVSTKPSGRWRTYPFADTFNPATDITTPPPFKIKLYGQNGRILHIFEMRDGKPINDKSLSQDRKDPNQALRPLFNSAMLLPWSSGTARESSKLNKHFPGFIDHPESRAKMHYSSNAALPMLGFGTDGRQQVNGLNQWHAMSKWPLSWSTETDPNFDKFGYDIARAYTGEGATSKSAWITGWGYEPGSVSGHDWYTGPGGIRFDRSVIPTPLAYLTSNRQYLRPKDRAPIRELAEAWGNAYFNHSSHYITDVKNLSTILNSEAERNASSHMGAYYGNGRVFAPLSQSVDSRAVPNGSYNKVGNNGGDDPSTFLDAQGNRFWNGYAVDGHHLYQTPYWHTILLNSPMHVVASKAAYNQAYLARLSSKEIVSRPANNWTPGNGYTTINSRVQAYRWMHYAMMWKSATTHSLGVSRSEVEKAFIDDLRKWHDTILVPTMAETKNPFHVALKQLGIPIQAVQDSQGLWYLKSEASSLSYYHATFFVTLKSLNLWDVLQKDPKAKASLDFVIESLNKFSLDTIVDTDGRVETEDGLVTIAGPFTKFEDITASSVPRSWREWALQNPAKGKENWITDANGKYVERYAGQHLRAQWAFVMKDWFPEIGGQRAINAANKYWSYFQEWKTNVDSKPTAYDQKVADFGFQPVTYWIIKPPQ
jgi:hypothetical protein